MWAVSVAADPWRRTRRFRTLPNSYSENPAPLVFDLHSRNRLQEDKCGVHADVLDVGTNVIRAFWDGGDCVRWNYINSSLTCHSMKCLRRVKLDGQCQQIGRGCCDRGSLRVITLRLSGVELCGNRLQRKGGAQGIGCPSSYSVPPVKPSMTALFYA